MTMPEKPPSAKRNQAAAHDTGSDDQSDDDVAQCRRLDVALGNAATRSHAARLVGALQIVKVLVGGVGHNLRQQGKGEAQQGRYPLEVPVQLSQADGHDHAAERHG